MKQQDSQFSFEAQLLRPKESGGSQWAFVVLPKAANTKLPRRGRTTVAGHLNGHRFQVMLEPDGQKSHWLRIDEQLLAASGAKFGDMVHLDIAAIEEPEPALPADLARALDAAPEARATWEATTTLARVDWIHWISSAKQAKTRRKRIKDASDMLAAGKKRVCCFDPSGYYSKAFSAPPACE